ncbi:MAG TPA: M20/M25/M40 family metallo-hydrolase [Candidatus Binataceae bacterium]|nr:M20/M25/M40 family metallo-hydrolase [Candidatus Binataceae bacterium]
MAKLDEPRRRLWLVAVLTSFLLTAARVRSETPKQFDWDALTRETTDLLSNYIKINTSDPPGNELPAAKMLKEKFLHDGIPAAVFEPAPGRGVIAARLRGTGKNRKALILLSHMDVVPADAKEWSVPPFSGEVKSGQVWGRGTLDDKGPGVVALMAMLAIKRARVLLDRDILFIATGDEEVGGKGGAGWVVDHQPNLYKDAGFVLNEGGGIRTDKAGHVFYSVAITEKSPLWLRLTATGPTGHAASPPAQTAVTRLVAALGKLIAYHSQVKVLPVVQEYFNKLATLDQNQPKLLDLRLALTDADFVKQFVATPRNNAMVRDTLTPTVIDAGYKTNIIPSTASAEIDCRLLPDENPKAFTKVIQETINDDSIKIEQLLSFPTLASPDRSELMNAIATLSRRTDKDAPVIPALLTGFNDSHYFRQRGLVAYGFIPILLTEQEGPMVHGANERIPIKSLRGGLERMVELLRIMGGQ